MSARRSRKHAAAEPPVNVQLLYEDGDVVPVDCVYIGWHPTERVHVWEAINPRPFAELRSLMIDKLPAATTIRVEQSIANLGPADRLDDD